LILAACAPTKPTPKAGPPLPDNVTVTEDPPPETMIRNAHAALERRDPGAGRLIVNRLLLGQPEHLEGRVLQAMLLEALGEKAEAAEIWTRVERIVVFQGKTVPFELQPALAAAALHYARDGKLERSRLFLDELWRRFPTGEWAARTQLAIAEADFAAERWARAAQACEDLIRIRTGHASGQRCATLARASRRMLEVGLEPSAGAPAWSWQHPQPQGNTLHDVWVGARGELCAVGEAGTILERRAGKELRLVASPTRWALHRIAGGEKLEGLYAVGAAGVILRHDGQGWTLSRKPSPELPDLWGAWVSEDGKQVVAVGDGGAVVELRDGKWAERRVSGVALRAVAGFGGAVYVAGEGGALLRATSPGGAWQSLPSDCYEDLWSAVALDGGKGLLLVGNRRTVVRFDGQRGQETIAGRNNLRDLWSAGPKQAWAVGLGGDAIAWNGKSWRSETTGTLVDLLGVGAYRPAEVWAVGAGGTVLARRGTRWALVAGGQSQDLVGVSASAGLALGERGQLLRRKGESWRTETHLPAGRYRDLWVDPSGTRAAAVGDRGLLLLRGKGGWKAVPSDTPEDLVSVAGFDGGLVAVGTRGTVVRLVGDAIQKDVTPTGLDLHAVWAGSQRSMVAVGNRGVVLRFDGERWSEQESGTLSDLRAVAGAGEMVVAGGAGGTVIRLEAGRWRPLPAPVQQTILDLWAGSSSQILAATARGTIVGHDGKAWRVHASPAGCLRAIDGLAGSGLAVGCHGSVLRLATGER
jgi:hypothetical protein